MACPISPDTTDTTESEGGGDVETAYTIKAIEKRI
jgi:hypothetical protein